MIIRFDLQNQTVGHDVMTLFQLFINSLKVMRYYSLLVDSLSLPEPFDLSAMSADGLIMAMRHKTSSIERVQFHPAAIPTESGLSLLKQFITTYTRERLDQ